MCSGRVRNSCSTCRCGLFLPLCHFCNIERPYNLDLVIDNLMKVHSSMNRLANIKTMAQYDWYSGKCQKCDFKGARFRHAISMQPISSPMEILWKSSETEYRFYILLQSFLTEHHWVCRCNGTSSKGKEHRFNFLW